MSGPTSADLARQHTLGDLAVPRIARDLNGGGEPELVWRNELDGVTFRVGDCYLKWNPRSTGIDLERERLRLDWISRRHPAPRVVDHGLDGDASKQRTELGEL
jgi:kanamycin kinase